MKLENLLGRTSQMMVEGVSYIKDKIRTEHLFYSCYAMIPVIIFAADAFVGNPRFIDGCTVRESEDRRVISAGSNLFPAIYVDRNKDGVLDEKYQSAFSRNTGVVMIPQRITSQDIALYDDILKKLRK
jgi:hypothetical protein